ncbi:hypothetical protein K2173_013367 [Erythroxylum novogranatense]|uniref:3'-5' exonuclease domain-containing protein n=1 Tax=Erythroxylum novogranatense TaxID=1862640 RepID=A0AAV8S9N9_9ROSI|nr:hypothetical protein K2173_013367 [Erythroxylum novogranatense]
MTPEITIVENQAPAGNHRLFTVNFFGTPISVTVTSAASVVREWINATLYYRRYQLGRLVVGMGVQWNPRNGNDPPADTLQLCVGTRCLIVQLHHCDTVPLALRRFLSEERYTFVGIWNGSDAKKLMMTEHELRVHRLLDLRTYIDNLVRASVERIVECCLDYKGVALDKEISMSDWDDWWLTEEQVRQACVKAYVAFEIGKNWSAWEL